MQTTIVDPTQFLTDFCKDLVAHAGDRPQIIAGYAKHLEAMLEAARKEGLKE